MKRLSIAALLAILFHGTLLVVEFPEPKNRMPTLSEFKTLNFSLLEENSMFSKKEKVTKPTPLQTIKKEPRKESPVQKKPPSLPTLKKQAVKPVKPKKGIKRVKTKKTVVKKLVEPSPAELIEKAVTETPEALAESLVQPSTPSVLKNEMDKEERSALTSAGQVVQEARPLYLINPPPLYPLVARKRKYEGVVILEVFVDKEGRVDNIRLFKTSGYPVLDKAALKSVTGWKFEPARRGRQAVGMWVRVPIRFRLED